MGFQRVVPMNVKGATLLGLSLDPLYSDEIDRDGLKLWVNKLSDIIPVEAINSENTGGITFHYVFQFELQYFCIFIAASDGELSDREIIATNWLLDADHQLNRNEAEAIKQDIDKTDWAKNYPGSFMMLVDGFGGQSKMNIQTAGDIARFYYQIARYIHGIDNPDPFNENASAFEYAKSFRKYVEWASTNNFLFSRPKLPIEEVYSDWEELYKEELKKKYQNACGTWRAISGNALFNGGLSDMVLEPNWQGYMTKKKLIGSGKIALKWTLEMVAGEETVTIEIPSLNAKVFLTEVSPDSMAAMVLSSNQQLDRTMAMYLRA